MVGKAIEKPRALLREEQAHLKDAARQKAVPSLDDFVSRAPENVQRLLVALLFHQNVVGVIGRDGKNRDAVLCQDLRDAGQYPDEREVQHPLDAEALLPVVALNNVRRDIAGGAYQGVLFIRLADEAVLCAKVYQRVVLHLAYREILIELLQFHDARSCHIPIE